MESAVNSNMIAVGQYKMTDKDSYLVNYGFTREGLDAQFLSEWDTWRIKKCQDLWKEYKRDPVKHAKTLPYSFRYGTVDWRSIITTIILKLKEVKFATG
jgi:hypothetical protein